MVRKRLALLALIALIVLTGCSENNLEKQIDKFYKLKSDMEVFAIKVFIPSKEADMVQGINQIREYCTEDLLKELEEDLGAFTLVDTTISELEVDFINKENTTERVHNKLIITFRVEETNRSQKVFIEFIEGNNGKYNRYYIHRGVMEGRKWREYLKHF